MLSLSGENEILLTLDACPRNVRTSRPECTSDAMIDVSSEPEAIKPLLNENMRPRMGPLWYANACLRLLVEISQTWTVASVAPEAMKELFCEKARTVTEA